MPRFSQFIAVIAVLFAGCYADSTINKSEIRNLSDDLVKSVQEGTFSKAESHLTFGIRTDLYNLYQYKYKDVPKAATELELSLKSFTGDTAGYARYIENVEGTGVPGISTGEEGSITCAFTVPEEALYQLYVEYYPVKGKNAAIERQIEINGAVPFYGATHFIMTRIWQDMGEPVKDNRGNEIRPALVEKPRIRSTYFTDDLGYNSEPYDFYFKAGKNTLTIRSVKEPVIFTKIVLTRKPAIPTYSEVKKTYTGFNDLPVKELMFQAEKTYEKSDQMIYPINDRTSIATLPYHHTKIRLNTIGGDHWKLPDQWITWEMDIPATGLYKLAVRARQNLVHGLKVNRRILIDGAVPFKEAEKFTFKYSTSWAMDTFANQEEPYLFYLTKGRHLLTMETTLGDLGPILQDVDDSIYALNYAYRKILMLTGPNPDVYRDYNIDTELPDVMQILAEQSLVLAGLAGQIEAYAIERSHAATLKRLSHMLAKMYTTPFSIPKTMKELKINVGSLANWVFISREQPLEIDYFVLQGKDAKTPGGEAGFFENFWFKTQSFFTSFFEDYDSVGNTYTGSEKNIITVWILSGRDQAQIIKRMVDDTFTPQTGIPVNIKLVMPEVLLPATVAGRGPDIAMQVGATEPVNYALRNAVVDLTHFPDYREVASRFHPSAIVPFQYQDGVFGLPDTQDFLVMFYRKDIFNELGLQYPDTWDDLYDIMPDLQKNYMDFLVPIRYLNGSVQVYAGSNTYNMLLFQNGGEIYRDGGIALGIDSEAGIKAFEDWTALFVNYKLPDYYDFRSRFRTGESPIGIQSYVEYNTLTVFAPEIRGLWGFVPVPATIQKDGTLNRSVPGSGYATVMLKKNNGKEDLSWDFMKWWSSADIQERYGKELESVMGPAARHPTANQEAIARLAWPANDYKNLISQWQYVNGVPEVPGSYYLPRHLDNAWRNVYYTGSNPRETLLEYVRKVNDEITSKRKEFGLKTIADLKAAENRAEGEERD